MSKYLMSKVKSRCKDYDDDFRRLCFNNEVSLGDVFVRQLNRNDKDSVNWIVSLPITLSWRGKASDDNVSKSLVNLRRWALDNGIKSIVIPALGCGKGTLEYQRVKMLVYRYFVSIKDVDVYFCVNDARSYSIAC
ncbi:macro domain-containing protein [Vibrio parahaemolyticus]